MNSFPFSNTIDLTDILLDDIEDTEDNKDNKDNKVNNDELKEMAIEDKATPLVPETTADTTTTEHTCRSYGLVVERIHPSQLKIKKFGITNKKPVLPTSVDLRRKLPPCYEQGELGSCTANAVCASFQYEDPSFLGSRLFIYYNERNNEGSVSGDTVGTLKHGISILEKYGVCAENDWPYDKSNYSEPPTPKCYTDATERHVITAMNVLNNPTAMKQCLAEGSMFVVGIQIYESFESQKVAKTGIVPMPNILVDKLLGGHTVLVCGYDDSKQVWIIRNSWGTEWGDHGYFYLPYAYLLNPFLSSDLWYVSRVETPESESIANIKEPEPIHEVVVRERSCTVSISTPELGPVEHIVDDERNCTFSIATPKFKPVQHIVDNERNCTFSMATPKFKPVQHIVDDERNCTFSIATPEIKPVQHIFVPEHELAAKIAVPQFGQKSRRGWFSRLFSCY